MFAADLIERREKFIPGRPIRSSIKCFANNCYIRVHMFLPKSAALFAVTDSYYVANGHYSTLSESASRDLNSSSRDRLRSPLCTNRSISTASA